MKILKRISWIALILNTVLLAVIVFFVSKTGTKDYDYIGYAVLTLILSTLSFNIVIISSHIFLGRTIKHEE